MTPVAFKVSPDDTRSKTTLTLIEKAQKAVGGQEASTTSCFPRGSYKRIGEISRSPVIRGPLAGVGLPTTTVYETGGSE